MFEPCPHARLTAKTSVPGCHSYLGYQISLQSCDILISVHYANWDSLYVLEIGLFEFVRLDAKALRSIALLFWLPTLNRSLQSILFGFVDSDIRK